MLKDMSVLHVKFETIAWSCEHETVARCTKRTWLRV